MAGKDKGGFCNVSVRDNRVGVQFSCSAILSWPKIAVGGLGLVLIAYLLLSTWVFGGNPLLRRRVQELETKLTKRLHWFMQHRQHLSEHIKASWAPTVHPDGRKHLLSPPGGLSRLAEAVAPDGNLAVFDDHYLCGDKPLVEAEVLKLKLALAAVSWMAPRSLRNSMESWRSSGLLDIADERMLFLNSPTAEDFAIAAEFDFDVYTTTEHDGNIMAGPSIAYLVGNSSADVILFLEKDFVVSSTREVMLREVWNGMQHMAKGVEVYRLRGNTDYPAEGMPDCCTPKQPPTCPYNSQWKSGGYFGDHMNWLFIWCDPDVLEHSNGRLVKCTSEPQAPDSYCFTSAETNWSNNPVLFMKKWFHERLRKVALADFDQNNLFEFNVMMEWLAWKPPARVCASFQGIFTHQEIDQ